MTLITKQLASALSVYSSIVPSLVSFNRSLALTSHNGMGKNECLDSTKPLLPSVSLSCPPTAQVVPAVAFKRELYYSFMLNLLLHLALGCACHCWHVAMLGANLVD